MRFEFSHLLHPLEDPALARLGAGADVQQPAVLDALTNAPSWAPRRDPAEPVDARTEARRPLSVLLEATDATNGQRGHVDEQPAEDLFADFFDDPAGQPVDDLFAWLVADGGAPAQADAHLGADDLDSAPRIVETSPSENLDLTGLTVSRPDEGAPALSAPAAASAPRSRFATPSLDDDFLPVQRRRR